ncbi:hypothetical protein PRN20_06510 [Devosia sp. ZB163]|uniref:hypothetical protein n=1 Tax=Devosia sp. ZB163 TaxID=3025938 RepID=UPI002361C785|nr:hypothetical protein [Devosia sp. ZB163]MDC9823378.1 hypothetical protein [Devosia sp. ZB163]
MSSALRIGAYALVVLVAGFELVVFWLMLHPDVPPDYRAYYIDKTTTCLNQPVAGTYALGTTIDFTPDGREAAKPLRVCGWEGPAGDGNHAVGTSARLRFVYTEPATALRLELRLVAVKKDDQPTQRVTVSVNGQPLGTLTVTGDPPQDFALDLPADLVSEANGHIEVEFDLPDAVQMRPTDPDNRRRSIKLVSAALIPA